MATAESPLTLVRRPATRDGWSQLIQLCGDRVDILFDELRKSVGKIDEVVQRLDYSDVEERWVVQYQIGGAELFIVRISPGVLESRMTPSRSEVESLLQNRTLCRKFRDTIRNTKSESGSSSVRFLLSDRRTVRSFANLARAKNSLILNSRRGMDRIAPLKLENNEGQVSKMVYQVKVKKSLSDVLRDLGAATQRHKFGKMGPTI